MEQEKANSIEKKIIDLTTRTHDSQEKFTYYILAVDAACIGFLVNFTKSDHWTGLLLPFIIAVVAWLVGFLFGIQEIIYGNYASRANALMLRAQRENNAEHKELYMKEFLNFDKKIVFYSKWKLWFLYGGAIAFLIGYFIRIYTN